MVLEGGAGGRWVTLERDYLIVKHHANPAQLGEDDAINLVHRTSVAHPHWCWHQHKKSEQNRTNKITTEQNRTESKLFSVSEVVKTTLSTGVGVGSIQLVGCHGQEEGDNPALTHPRVISVNTP